MKNIALAAEYCRIIAVKRIGLFYRVCNDPSVTVLDGGDIFLASFTPFYVFVEIKTKYKQSCCVFWAFLIRGNLWVLQVVLDYILLHYLINIGKHNRDALP